MPILDIEIILKPGEVLPEALASQIADRAGEVFGAAPGTTWIKLRSLPREQYSESGGLAEDIYPVFVSVLKAQLPALAVLQEESVRLSQAIALVCDRPPENVHIIYQAEGRGRVAFGGKLVEG